MGKYKKGGPGLIGAYLSGQHVPGMKVKKTGGGGTRKGSPGVLAKGHFSPTVENKGTTTGGTTQPNVIDYLGVVSPTVNKWNKRIGMISKLIGGG